MIISIFGYRQSGKTCLFEILSHRKSDGHHTPVVQRHEIPRAVCEVPDSRLELLSSLYPERKKVRAHLEIEDFPGLASGDFSASQYLAQLRKADGLVHVVRGFRDPAIVHPGGKIDPADDIR